MLDDIHPDIYLLMILSYSSVHNILNNNTMNLRMVLLALVLLVLTQCATDGEMLKCIETYSNNSFSNGISFCGNPDKNSYDCYYTYNSIKLCLLLNNCDSMPID